MNRFFTIENWLDSFWEVKEEEAPLFSDPFFYIHEDLYWFVKSISDAEVKHEDEKLILEILNQLDDEIRNLENNKKEQLLPLEKCAQHLRKNIIQTKKRITQLNPKVAAKENSEEEKSFQPNFIPSSKVEPQSTTCLNFLRKINNVELPEVNQTVEKKEESTPPVLEIYQVLYNNNEQEDKEYSQRATLPELAILLKRQREEYDKILDQIQSIKPVVSPYQNKNIKTITTLAQLLCQSKNIYKLITPTILGTLVHIINELDKLYEKAKKQQATFQSKLNPQYYREHMQENVGYAVKMFLWWLDRHLDEEEELQSERNRFFSLIQTILNELVKQEELLPHRKDNIITLQQEILTIGHKVGANTMSVPEAIQILWLYVETEKNMARADSRMSNSRLADSLENTTKYTALKPPVKVSVSDDIDILKKIVTKALDNYYHAHKQRTSRFRNRVSSQKRLDMCNLTYMMLIQISARHGKNNPVDAVHLIKIELLVIIKSIKQNHRNTSWLGWIGITQSLLARKLEAVSQLFPAVPQHSVTIAPPYLTLRDGYYVQKNDQSTQPPPSLHSLLN